MNVTTFQRIWNNPLANARAGEYEVDQMAKANGQLGGIFIVAGTCIGGGVIALPMMLASVGLIFTVVIMAVMWAAMYYSALINLELNLQAGCGMDIGNLGRHFSGPGAAWLGRLVLLSLMYALMAAYFYGLSSLLVEILHLSSQSRWLVTTSVAVVFCALMVLPVRGLDSVNKPLFIGMLVIAAFLLIGLSRHVSWDRSLLFPPPAAKPHHWIAVVPVLFTSFGFQVIFHTLSDYYALNGNVLRRVFLWGSLIPAVVYIAWTVAVLLAIHGNNPSFYGEMVLGRVDVGTLVAELSRITANPAIRSIVWAVSILAIATSMVGVGLGLCTTLQAYLPGKFHLARHRALPAAASTIPPLILALLVPGAFTAILGAAGVILAILAILLPLYLVRRGKFTALNYPVVGSPLAQFSIFIAAVLIIFCELAHAHF
jgi:tyrosine-specific transport protein